MHCSKGEALTPPESNRLTSLHVDKETLARQVTNVSRELTKWENEQDLEVTTNINSAV
jgi:hypothetical protein